MSVTGDRAMNAPVHVPGHGLGAGLTIGMYVHQLYDCMVHYVHYTDAGNGVNKALALKMIRVAFNVLHFDH